jgi:hypothetical protein
MRETLLDRLKLIAAGLFVVAGVLGFVCGLSLFFPRLEAYPAWLAESGAVVVVVVFLGIAVALFNRPIGRTNVRKLEKQDMLLSRAYEARRAFQVKELGEEGLHYFIELDDHSVLFLSGKYLYNYDSEDQPRTFPCTAFAVRRHRTEGYVADIVCQGSVLEPEVIAPPFDANDFGTDTIPEDGQIVTDKSYERLKAERLEAASVRTPTP